MNKINKIIIASIIAVCASITPITTNAAAILFAHVNWGYQYKTDGNNLAQMLTDAGHTVTIINLNTAIYTNYSDYEQIFVYDLFSGTDNSPNQLANYANIGDWYSGLQRQNLIMDARIVASSSSWTNRNAMPAENTWIQNYASQLDLYGGGLVLGTDHSAFHSGISYINQYISINPFYGRLEPYPTSQAVVDVTSSLYVSGLANCRFNTSLYCINNNSSSGIVPIGPQPNGQVLYPIASSGDSYPFSPSRAVISTTMINFPPGTCGKINQPLCSNGQVKVPEPTPITTLLLGLLGLALIRKRKISEQLLNHKKAVEKNSRKTF